MLTVPINVELQKVADFIFQEPSPPRAFYWLFGGVQYSVRPEPRGQGVYWYMRKMVDRQKHNIYVAPEGKLTAELLNNAARQIAAHASPVKPKGAL